MGLSKKQQLDIKIIEFFTPKINFTKLPEYHRCGAIEDSSGEDADIMFLENSDKGIDLMGRKVNDLWRLEKLIWGKKWRGIWIHELWKAGIDEGTLFISELKEDLPNEVFNFVEREYGIE